MRDPNDGQSSQNTGNDRKSDLARHWSDVRIETLREFTSELCAELTYRGAATATGLSKEGLRRFVEGESHPNRSTRQTLGEMFLKLHPGGSMWKTSKDGAWQLRVQLIELLPAGEQAARDELARIFELAKRSPDEAPASVDQVHEWMDLQVQGEYWGRRYLDSFGVRKRRRKGEGKRPHHPRAKKAKPGPAGEDSSEEG
jgi:hypothetical protein